MEQWAAVDHLVGRYKDSYDDTWHSQRENLLKAFKYRIVSALPLYLL